MTLFLQFCYCNWLESGITIKSYMSINITRYFIISLVIVVFATKTSEPVYADNNPTEHTSNESEDLVSTFINNLRIRSFGFQTDVVFTDEFDTGLGFGARFQRAFFHPSLGLTTSVNFWGASKDSLDVSTAGFEESLTVQKSPNEKFSVFSGITIGYYAILKKNETVENNVPKTIETRNNSFEAFIIIGSAYTIKNNRSVFLQVNYGLTQDSDEIHMLIGINFFK